MTIALIEITIALIEATVSGGVSRSPPCTIVRFLEEGNNRSGQPKLNIYAY